MTTPLFPAAMTEAGLQDMAAEYLRLRGWLVFHPRPARTNDGWRTAGRYDSKGFPDLTCARNGVVRLVEVKGPRGRLTVEQKVWCAEGDVFLLTPATVDEFLEEFR